jgi:hypothetical protein
MAALLTFAPAHGAQVIAETIVRLKHNVEATLSRQENERQRLACSWAQDADGRLFCYWEIEPADIPLPPTGAGRADRHEAYLAGCAANLFAWRHGHGIVRVTQIALGQG